MSKIVDQLPNYDVQVLSQDVPALNAQVYTTADFDNNELNQKNDDQNLGLGDFLVFNLMLLFVLPSSSTIFIQICVGIGCVIIINIGQVVANTLAKFFQQSSYPAVPLPVITVSFYIVLLKLFFD